MNFRENIHKYIDNLILKNGSIRVLEAGCGVQTYFTYKKEHVFVEGIDISPDQLAKNEILDKKILGDIQTYKLQTCHYDLIVCFDVLEHIPEPEKALVNMAKSLKKEGLMVIGLPNLRSLKGFVTKHTPYKFHQWVYKYVYRFKKQPFKTYFRSILDPDVLIKYINELNFSVEWIHFYHVSPWENKNRKYTMLCIFSVYFLLGILAKIISFGRLGIINTDLILVFKKKYA